MHVQSSNVAEMQYQGSTLIVRFASGRTYQYKNVPLKVYAQLAQAKSVGQAFNDLIRSHPERYPYSEVKNGN
jgi:hypothetical protein